MRPQCLVCGVIIERPDGAVGRPRTTCSDDCKRRLGARRYAQRRMRGAR